MFSHCNQVSGVKADLQFGRWQTDKVASSTVGWGHCSYYKWEIWTVFMHFVASHKTFWKRQLTKSTSHPNQEPGIIESSEGLEREEEDCTRTFSTLDLHVKIDEVQVRQAPMQTTVTSQLTLDLGEPPQFSSAHLQDGPGIKLRQEKQPHLSRCVCRRGWSQHCGSNYIQARRFINMSGRLCAGH